MEQTFVLKIYRGLERNRQKIHTVSSSQLVHQDTLRFIERPEESRLLHCMHMIECFRFNRGIIFKNLRSFKYDNQLEEWKPHEITM
jgi:hypothetical protein